MRAEESAYSYFFLVLAGVRQGGLLSPALFAIYMCVWFLDYELLKNGMQVSPVSV